MENELAIIRKKIDEIDKQIVELLVKRIGYALEALKYKNSEEDIRGCDRVKLVLNKVRDLAVESGGYDVIIVKIYERIIELLTELQLDIFYKSKAEH